MVGQEALTRITALNESASRDPIEETGFQSTAPRNVLTKSTIGSGFMFTARYRDPVTGLDYFRFRTQDTLTLYSFVRNSAVNLSDPYGLIAPPPPPPPPPTSWVPLTCNITCTGCRGITTRHTIRGTIPANNGLVQTGAFGCCQAAGAVFCEAASSFLPITAARIAANATFSSCMIVVFGVNGIIN